jgi:hypothetical protein
MPEDRPQRDRPTEPKTTDYAKLLEDIRRRTQLQLTSPQATSAPLPTITSPPSPTISPEDKFLDPIWKKTQAPEPTSRYLDPRWQKTLGPKRPEPLFNPYKHELNILKGHYVGGVGTPTELRAGFGYDASSAVHGGGAWPTDVSAKWAANSVAQMFSIGVRPSFITPFVKDEFGFTDEDMAELKYIKHPSGMWTRVDVDDTPQETIAGSAGGGGGGGYRPRVSYSAPQYQRGYGSKARRTRRTMGLTSWRI